MSTTWKLSKPIGLGVICLVYAATLGVGLAVFTALPGTHFFVRLLVADVGATVFIYFASLVFGNASLYDPYWSVAPVAISVGTALSQSQISPAGWLVLVAIGFWGVRLTCNWAHTFTNLATQDWRYDLFKNRFPRLFPLISLAGIMLFPTLVVYLCLLPAVQVLRQPSQSNALVVAGFTVCLVATLLQLAADRQMHRFRRNQAGQPGQAGLTSQGSQSALMQAGLWHHARHPNYLGEILMWWGVFAMVLAQGWTQAALGAGALVNTLMFWFISMPMADRRNRAVRLGFDDYFRQTNALLPFKFRTSRNQADTTH
ncbi:MAG: DUF1295 domain-containing protein [Micrococcales bacterium]|nr:DUF1295 domain-containing protein [Micrococcales bacterium]